ncbi:MAG: HAMP domain-containing protein [Acidobacteria bacterium]|nr:HAMP domain-containing protein [Acidobacteriota bacterium]
MTLATALRDDSNNLTRFAQLYVIRGEPRFRDYFDRILAIRAGTAPRPGDYDGTYWDRVLAGHERIADGGGARGLDALLDDLAVPDRVVARLRQGADLSNQLALLETSVMDRAAVRTERGPNASATPDASRLVDQLTNSYYYSVKGQIMANIERFGADVDRITADRLRGLARRTSLYLKLGGVLVTAEVLWTVTIAFGSRSLLFGPLRELERSAHAVSRGQLGEQATVAGAAELRDVIGAFNVMSVAVSRDIRTGEAVARSAPT